ncbi:hypothetical protein AB3S75_004866 [Citrus x aurantiifolia]
MALKFLNKKGWHTGSLRNIENVWKAEQKHEAEQKKLDELRKQILEERERSEFRQLQEQAGLVPRQERLDFLYDSGLSVGRSDGAASASTSASGSGFKALEQPSSASGNQQSSVPGALFDDKPYSAGDAWRKLHSDPLLLIRQREQEALARVKNNPIKMALIRKSAEEKKGKAKKKHKDRSGGKKERAKKHRSSSKHSSSGQHSDSEYATSSKGERQGKIRNHNSSHPEEERLRNRRSDSGDELTERTRSKIDRYKDSKYREQSASGFSEPKNKKSDDRDSMKMNHDRSDSHYKRRYVAPKLSEEELAARLHEMQANAELHEEQRWKRLKKAEEDNAREATRDRISRGKNFLDAAQKSVYGAEKGGSSTIEERVRRRTYYSQGRDASEGHAFRR